MLDPFARRLLHRPLDLLAAGLQRLPLSPNLLTFVGLGVGLGVLPALAWRRYDLALWILLVNRLLDGLDGALARRLGPTDYGAYLDIVFDMIFYAVFVLGMALAEPENAFWAAMLLCAFMGTSSSFLAYAVLAQKHGLQDPERRGLYYLTGLAEGTETVIFFVAFLLYPWLYKVLALVFVVLCWITVVARLWMVRSRLRQLEAQA